MPPAQERWLGFRRSLTRGCEMWKRFLDYRLSGTRPYTARRVVASNIEVKATIPEFDLIRRKVAAMTPDPSQMLDQRDTFFVVPGGRLKVREFADGSGELISYQRANEV